MLKPSDSQRSLMRALYAENMNAESDQAPYRVMQRTKKTGRGKKLGLLLLVIVLVLVGVQVLWAKRAPAEVSVTYHGHAAVSILAAQKADKFAGQVNALINANSNVTFSVVTISSTNGLQHYGSNMSFDGASTGKLLTAADYLHHFEIGTATLNQDIDGQNAEYLLKIMLVNSDDTAWAELNDYLTHADLSQYASSIGFTDYDPADNTFTSTDVAQLLQKLYDRQLLDTADRSLMLSYLKQANYRNFILPAVPSSDTVYHKVGLDNDNVHDAAIITHANQHLILVIFTNGNGTYEWSNRAQLMQTITRDALAAYL